MSSKIGFILSLVFFFQAMVFATDIINYQIHVSEINMVSISVDVMVESDRGFVNAKNYVSQKLNGELVCLENCSSIQNGNFVTYVIKVKYTPMMKPLGDKDRFIIIERTILIGNR